MLDHFARHRALTFSSALALLLLVGTLSIWGIDRLVSRSQWVGHSYEVLAAIEAVQTGVRTAESTARAYRITEAPAQHAEYLAAAPEALARADALVALVADNPAQAQRAQRIQALAVEREADLQRLMEIQDTQGVDVARRLTATTRGVRAMLQHDRNFDDGLPRKALIDAFRVTDDPALVSQYRRRMSSLLF